jgi:itaconyl-CoA hydratase
VTFPAYYRIGPHRYVERFGLSYEDFAAGQRFRHRPGITVTQQDNAEEALDTLNSAMLHFDAEYAAHTTWGRPLVVSTLTVQRVLGMTSKTFALRTALPAIEELRLGAPVLGGDTLYAESEILDTRDGDQPEAGVITVRTVGLAASGTEVVSMRYRACIARRCSEDWADPGEPADEPRFAAYELDGAVHVERFGLFFEDCRPGECFVHAPRRTVLLQEAIAHARRSLDYSARYHDVSAGGRFEVPPTFVLAVATTPATRTFARVVANLGWQDVAFPRPVYAGDTLQAESEILEARTSRSRPGEGLLLLATRAVNQHGETVLTYRRRLLVYRRGGATPFAASGYAA